MEPVLEGPLRHTEQLSHFLDGEFFVVQSADRLPHLHAPAPSEQDGIEPGVHGRVAAETGNMGNGVHQPGNGLFIPPFQGFNRFHVIPPSIPLEDYWGQKVAFFNVPFF
ncbi:MAG: hypothetical protein ACOX46_12475 [Limnochordia bacterium]